MEEIKLTYRPEMKMSWFLEMFDMVVSCNPNRRISIVDSQFHVRVFANGMISYIFRGAHISHALFIAELTRWMLVRKGERERETAAYSGRAS